MIAPLALDAAEMFLLWIHRRHNFDFKSETGRVIFCFPRSNVIVHNLVSLRLFFFFQNELTIFNSKNVKIKK